MLLLRLRNGRGDTVTFLQLAVIFLGILCILNTIAVVALIRQVGILHLRIKPVAGLTGAGGPERGATLELPATLPELAQRDAERFLIGFVSPTCAICGSLMTAFVRIAKSARSDTAVVLVIDASEPAAREYVRARGATFLPYLADSSVFAANVPGAPWAVVTDGSGTVIVSGGVNTLDNVEEMLAQAAALNAAGPEQVTVELTQPTVGGR
jgi:hypothetical protein